MTRGRAGGHRDDHVGELESEDPARIYNNPQHRRKRRNLILLEKTKSTSHELAVIETLPTDTNCLRPDR